jgi:hypothetical protein
MWGGMMPNLVNRWRRFNRWSKDGVISVKVFYEPHYFIKNRHFAELMDPLHMYYVAKYAAIKG